MKSPYLLTPTEKSHCPKCHRLVWILSNLKTPTGFKGPAFYVCFECKYVGHIGVGPVDCQPELPLNNENQVKA